jgi:hypothetical protein
MRYGNGSLPVVPRGGTSRRHRRFQLSSCCLARDAPEPPIVMPRLPSAPCRLAWSRVAPEPRGAASPPGTAPNDAPSHTPSTAKPAPGAEPPPLAGAASRPEPSTLARLPELEVLADEHHHHRLSYRRCRGCIEEV